jgi:hypothetical protein
MIKFVTKQAAIMPRYRGTGPDLPGAVVQPPPHL